MTHKIVRKHYVGTKSSRSKIRTFKLGQGISSPQDIRDELEDMRAVLLGEVESPIEEGIITLMEVAEAYFSRACDIEQSILRAQAEGRILKERDQHGKVTDPYHQLRTQELRSFKEMAKSATELGSRRITAASLIVQQELRGRESI